MMESFMPQNFAWFGAVSSLVLNDWLYIHGGQIWARWDGPENSASTVFNDQTFAIDLTKSWTTESITAVKTNYSTNQASTLTPQIWYDSAANKVYTFGGEPHSSNGEVLDLSIAPQSWSFEPSTDGTANWQSQSLGNGDAPMANVITALTVYTPTSQYSLGGATLYNTTGGVQKLPQDDLLKYSYADQTWTNVTLAADQERMSGQAIFVPNYGEEGVIVYIGGANGTDTNSASTYYGFDSILVYDIHSGTFHSQSATNAPLSRTSFCAVGASSPSNSSFEIFMYGGSQPFTSSTITTEGFSQVWILTIPAFTWVSVPNSSVAPRTLNICQVIGNRHMLSMGGGPPAGLQALISGSDPWTNGLGIFDMVALNWTMSYDHTAAAYEAPSLVTNIYAAGSRYPSTWGDSTLQSIFTSNNSTSNGNNNGNGNNGNSGGGGGGKSSNTGAIAGGVVGGIAVIAAIIFGIWFCRRRRSRRNATTSADTHSSPEDLPSEMYSPPPAAELHSPDYTPKHTPSQRRKEMYKESAVPNSQTEGLYEMPAEELKRPPVVGNEAVDGNGVSPLRDEGKGEKGGFLH